MPIDATTATTPASTVTPLATPPSKDQLGTDTFLNLLVAQLKYQNPMSPSDGTEFLAQTAQFTMVEKLTEMADLAKKLLNDNQSLAAASLLGKTVSWADASGTIQHGVVSAATFGSDGPSVLIGEVSVPMSQIRDVSAAVAPAPAGATSPATDDTTQPDADSVPTTPDVSA